MEELCRRYLISGKVQGVFYRQNTLQTARTLTLKGWVRNLPDGKVEVVACGQLDVLNDFERWLWEGPVQARVDDVVVLDHPLEESISFEIR